MPEQRRRGHRVYGLMISLVLIAVPLAVYAYLHFNSRYDYFERRNFRALNEIERQLAATFNNLERVFDTSLGPKNSALSELLSKSKLKSGESRVRLSQKIEATWAVWQNALAQSEEDWRKWVTEQLKDKPSFKEKGIVQKREIVNNLTEYIDILVELGGMRSRENERRDRLIKLTQIWKERRGEPTIKKYNVYIYKRKKIRDRPVPPNPLRQLRNTLAYKNIAIWGVKREECGTIDDGIKFKIESDGFGHWLEATNCDKKNEERKNQSFLLQVRLPLKDLIHPDIILGNFDFILAAEADGRVIYSAQKDGQVINGNGGVIEEDGMVFPRIESLQPFLSGRGSEHSLQKNTPKSNSLSTEELQAVKYHSAIREENIGGTDYRLFLQPFRLPGFHSSQPNDTQDTLYLCGAVRTARFRSEAIPVPLTVMGLALIALLLGILSWPYLKILFISANQSLATTDVSFSALSLMLGSALITVLLMDTMAYRSLSENFDRDTQNIAKEMLERFENERGEAIKLLHTESKYILNREKENKLGSRGIKRKQIPKDILPPFEILYVINQEGKFLKKTTYYI